MGPTLSPASGGEGLLTIPESSVLMGRQTIAGAAFCRGLAIPVKQTEKKRRTPAVRVSGGVSKGARQAVHDATIRAAGPSRLLWSLLATAIGVARALRKRRRGNLEA